MSNHMKFIEERWRISPPRPQRARFGVQRDGFDGRCPRSPRTALIYIVDDEPELTHLYSLFLEGTGYSVQMFNEREEALAKLEAEGRKPDLLVMDYCGHSIPFDQFMRRCIVLHSRLRVLIASGFAPKELFFASVKPDRFLQKPFTGDEFVKEVRAALAAPVYKC